MTPLFFFGSLRDRALLEAVLGHDVSADQLAEARAEGHRAQVMAAEAYPCLIEAAGDAAQGVVVSGLSADDLARLEYFEEAEYGLAPIRVETAQGPVDARYFHATGKMAAGNAPWDFARWQREDRAVAIEAALELMAHFGIVAVEDMDTIWPGIMIRAHMRARAKAETPVTGTLRPARQDAVRTVSVQRPYTRFFAVEEHRLQHRLFNGGWSREITRSVVTSGDAVTIVPYDAARDRVLLIEQFRAPMHVRGDACPWGIEAIAGRIDKELSAEAAARREAEEEAGITLGRIEQLARYYSSPGFAAEHITSLVGEASLEDHSGVFGVAGEDEDIRAFTVSLDQALAGVASGEINNAPAIMTLHWLQLNRERLQAAWG